MTVTFLYYTLIAYCVYHNSMAAPTLIKQTTYAELLERCTSSAFSGAFPEDGVFAVKTIKEKRYWYFQTSTAQGRTQQYVGPETPELLERIARHREVRDDERERRSLVSMLVRSCGLPRPLPEAGEIIALLAKAGVFRLRGILVGTLAYQVYSAMLGVKLPLATLQTADVDIAQFKNISVAVKDQIPPILEMLKRVDKTFRAVPNIHDNRRATSYQAKGGLRVDFLTPNEGPDTEQPEFLPAFQTDAQPLRFLDYLIHKPEPAVVLYGAGVSVLVPVPERFAIHKLIVSRRRPVGAAKRDKDLQQAESLFKVLAQKSPYELKTAWEEACGRGPKWRQLLLEGMSQLAPRIRDIVLKSVGERRETAPNLDLTFQDPPPRFDFDRDIVTFVGQASGSLVKCSISGEALDDHFGQGEDRVLKFRENRSEIEKIARLKYLSWPIEDPENIFIKTEDVRKYRLPKNS